MSDINANIIVSPIDLNVSVNTNQLSFTPNGVSLQFYTAGLVTSNALNANINNVHISGGTNGYVLQTDGTGNLNWTAMSGGGGNGAPGGANTQVQYNNSGLFGGNLGFTFIPSSGNLNVPGNVTAPQFVGNILYANTSGTVITNAQPNITSLGTLTSLTVSGNITTTGTTSIQQAKEKVTLDATGATGTVNFDILTQAILYKTANASNNFTLNIRGDSVTTLNSIMSNGQSVTCTLINTNGTSGYYANVISIDGNTITPKWPITGAPTSGTASGVDTYTFNIIKTNTNVFTVLASRAGFQ